MVSSPSEAPSIVLHGLAGSAGLAYASVHVVDTRRPAVVHRRVQPEQEDEELDRYDLAVASAARGLLEVAERVRSSPARVEASILEAYVLMVKDETLRQRVAALVRDERMGVEWALERAIDAMASALAGAGDSYLAERSHDLRFVGERLQRALSGRPRGAMASLTGEPVIIVAHDLSPAETAGFTRERVAALVTEVGTRTSHTAILARALHIPAVVGVADVLAHVAEGDRILVDGLRGRVVVRPDTELLADAGARAERHEALERGRRAGRGRSPTTRCGRSVALRANLELPSEAREAAEVGAQGVGLYRTEFLYVDRVEAPSEQEQYETYRGVLESFHPHPVTLRTFDLGSDKASPAFGAAPEANPALGVRGVRLALARPELLLAQLRAILRAAVHGTARIMIPMVATLGEVAQVKALVELAAGELRERREPFPEAVPLGVMIEVPSAALLADALAREAEFFSIGTNDLVQYTLGVDRASAALARLGSYWDPAVLRLVRGVVAAAGARRRPLALCGAMASDPLSAVLLVGMGVCDLSMEPSALPHVAEALSRVTLAEAEEVARAIEGATESREVEQILRARLESRLGDLLEG
ncbi:MAG: phosphoenolpyruvate--protein phosphotransferase [Polyangiaceae bacterium]|nr:phosphoenolpyruvate--protein phosphotransferase [Polyangiaceae bacterium]